MEYAYQNSVISQILEAIINETSFEGESRSVIGDILLSILNETPYEGEANSVIAQLFLKVKAKIEGESFDPYEGEHIGRIADILISILEETEYTDAPQSRIAELLLQLKEELEAYTELTVSGAIANFTTNVSKPLVNLKAYFNATQEAGTPTPSTPKAISGVSAVNLTQTKKNLFNVNNIEKMIVNASSQLRYARAFTKPSTYTISSTVGIACYIYATVLSGGEYSSPYYIQVASTKTPKTITINSGDILIVYDAQDHTLSEAQNVLSNTQVEIGSSSSDFEQYNGTTQIINLGGTYYGGYVEQDKDGHRKLVVTSKKIDLGSLNWSEYSGTFYAIITDRKYANIPFKDNSLCDSFKLWTEGQAVTQMPNYYYRFRSDTDKRVYFKNESITTASDFKTSVLGVYMTYELAEPIEIDLTDGEPIIAFNGVNNVYNDSANSEVTYLYKGEPPVTLGRSLSDTLELSDEITDETRLELSDEIRDEMRDELRLSEVETDDSDIRRS